MTREDIIRMAREAGGVFIDPPCGDCYTFDIDDGTLERFAALVVAAEREACAKAFEEEAITWHAWPQAGAARRLGAAAIRARGETK